jgi:hypothetical protein
MKNKTTELKIKIDLNPESKVKNSKYRVAYTFYTFFIDAQIVHRQFVYDFLFMDNTKVLDYRWKVAIVTVNNVAMIIPCSIDKNDPTKSWLFNPFTRKGFQLSNEDALKVSFCWFLSLLIFHEDFAMCSQFLKDHGRHEIFRLNLDLKCELYNNPQTSEAVFNLLD